MARRADVGTYEIDHGSRPSFGGIIPGFVITGAQVAPDRAIIYASTDLTESEMHAVTEEVEEWDPMWKMRVTRPGRTVYTLVSTMGRITVVTGRDFAEALRNLFRQWSPDKFGPHELDPGVREALHHTTREIGT
jgi:hypothetical protein